MKKSCFRAAIILAIAAFLFFAPSQSQAQIVTKLVPTAVNDTLTNADTAWVYISHGSGANTSALVESNARSIQTVVTKVSGTVAGSFTLEGTIDGTNWISIATDTFTNSATNTKSYNLRNSTGDLQFLQYRGVFITSGTTVVIPKLYLLRRN